MCGLTWPPQLPPVCATVRCQVPATQLQWDHWPVLLPTNIIIMVTITSVLGSILVSSEVTARTWSELITVFGFALSFLRNSLRYYCSPVATKVQC